VKHLAMAFVTFEPYQLTVKSNEVFFIGGHCPPEAYERKGAVGKSAARFTSSVLLERLPVPSLLGINHLV